MNERADRRPNEAQLSREVEELRRALAAARQDEESHEEEIRRLHREIAELTERVRRRQQEQQ